MELSIALTLQQVSRRGHAELVVALPHRQFTSAAASREYISATRTAKPPSLNLAVNTSYWRPTRSTRAAWLRRRSTAARFYFARGRISIESKSSKSNRDSNAPTRASFAQREVGNR